MSLKTIFNLHFTDSCNYRCKCCYAKNSKQRLNLEEIKSIVDSIALYFSKMNIQNGRINIAGGEPTTCPYLQDIIDYIHIKNIRASLITNGSLLTENFILNNKGKLEQIGLSIDSINDETNLLLGRCQKNITFNYQKLVLICKTIKAAGIKLKINTVVSKLNIHEDITKLLDEVEPDRIKILQMKPTTTIANNFAICESDFEKYTKKYSKYNAVIEKISSLENAYVIIDSKGYLTTENRHIDKRFNLLEKSLLDVIDKIDFDAEKEAMRYVDENGNCRR